MPSPLALLQRFARGLLDRSRAGFESDRLTSGLVALGLVALVTVATTAGIVGLGIAFDATIDREVTVDNPDRPPASTCDSFGDDEDSLTPVIEERCDEPERVEVDVGEELRSATGGYAGYGLIGVPIWWAIFALALHAGARLTGGSGSVGDSFVIAAWSLVPELLRLVAGLAAIWYALATTTVEGTTVEAIADEVVAAMSTVEGPLLAASLVVIAVQWVIVVGGLEATHDLDRGTAGAVAGVLAALGFLLAAA
ncbi:Yip1 family protein [Halorubrum sp. AD140]|uniref:Yip1 family protein n=1 Tax=Halorubrum sp. AD140 TaxID=3050073 RepID=UPI002ACC70BE|nr:Yip1 family protein [Halorubrum sp. AD140]MDZ5811042.1 Yip1 family protein [Halorubrum sp. AD140]